MKKLGLCAIKEIEEQMNRKTIHFPYREDVGSILYLATKTRPEIMYSVNITNWYIENSTKEDVFKVKKIMKYLNGTRHVGVKYGS